jgi:hypothetical protein
MAAVCDSGTLPSNKALDQKWIEAWSPLLPRSSQSMAKESLTLAGDVVVAAVADAAGGDVVVVPCRAHVPRDHSRQNDSLPSRKIPQPHVEEAMQSWAVVGEVTGV